MSDGLTVLLHDATDPVPDGWAEFVDTQSLPAIWDWAIVSAAALDRSPTVLATVRDGERIVGLLTGRFIGARTRRGGVPVAGLIDVDCLTSSSLPGLVLAADADAELFGEAVSAARDELGRQFGSRLHGLLLRQIAAGQLPAVLRWPAIVREGGPIAVFRNEFPDFDSYLASLSKRRRGTLRKTMRDFEADQELALRFTGWGDPRIPLDPARVRELGDSVVHRNHTKWWLRKRLTTARLLLAELAHPGVERASYHDLTRPDGADLLAFALVWQHPRWPHLGVWGAADAHGSGRRDLWFHLIASMARWCIESGREGFHCGQGSIPEKVRMGHELHRQWAVFVPQRLGRRSA